MMKRCVLILAAVVYPGVAHAQAGPKCDLIQSRQSYSVGNGAVTYIGGPVFTCDNGTRILADSAVYVQSAGRIDFIGHVRFNETQRSLTSQYAQYVGRERRLMAQGSVFLTDKTDGSVLRAPALDYYQKGGKNTEDRIEVFSGRPHATLFRKRTENTAIIDTTNVDADRMTIVGQQIFRGIGNVDMRRGKMVSKAGYAEMNQTQNFMKLYERASVQTDTFRLSADSIDATLLGGDKFKDVFARRNAKLHSSDVDVDAPRITIKFEEGNVDRMIAVGGKPAGGPQAKATSTDFTLIADSIDARTPKQKLDRVYAVGTAFGERAPDSSDAKLPAIIRKDWVRGDTVLAYFGDGKHPELAGRDTVARPVNAADTTRVLERIIALGGPASSTYKLKEKVSKDSTEISVNYLTAQKIDVVMKEGGVDHVRAEGDIRGMYLQPPKKETTGKRP